MSSRANIETMRNINNNNKVLYIASDYLKLEELKDKIYIREDYSDELLGQIWQNYDFKKAEERVLELQCKLTKATFARNNKRIKQLQNKIVYSSEAKMIAVRKVSEISKSSAGIDGIVWRSDSDKMRAVINLNNGEYKAKPLKYFIFRDNKSRKRKEV